MNNGYDWIKYKQWLLKKVGFDDNHYKKLIQFLDQTNYIWNIDWDENREMDGRYLREECNLDLNPMDAPVSVLEVLIAFAIRIDDEYLGDPRDPHPEVIFSEMLDNLGLLYYDDSHFSWSAIQNSLRVWLNREFEPNGVGSPFPLRHPPYDQREIQLWDQMNAYISENYGIS